MSVPESSLSSLQSVTHEIVGFFIIESHVLATTGNFRSERDVEELWEALVKALTTAVENTLKKEKEPDSYLRAKEILLGFVMTLEVRILVTRTTPILTYKNDSLIRTLRIACIRSSSFYLRGMLVYWRSNTANDSNR